MKKLSSDLVCMDCGEPSGLWMTTNLVWQAVMVTEENPRGIGRLCVRCFHLRAEASGLQVCWEFKPKPMPDHLKRNQ